MEQAAANQADLAVFGELAMCGYYPGDLRWRVDLTVWLAIVGVAPLFISRFPRKAIYGLGFRGRVELWLHDICFICRCEV